jgi:hypothetical protein
MVEPPRERSVIRVGVAAWIILLALSNLVLGMRYYEPSNVALFVQISEFIGFVIGPAIVPLILWGILRFRWQRAAWPLGIWTVWLVLSFVGLEAERTYATDEVHESTRICPDDSEFCVTFPGEPSLKAIDIVVSSKPITAHRYEFFNEGTGLRAQFTYFPLAQQLKRQSDDEFRQQGVVFANTEGILYPEVSVTVEPAGRVLTIRGSKKRGDETVKILCQFYYGSISALDIIVAEDAQSFPSVMGKNFIKSIERQQ